jgi:hypothetical protein
VCGTARDWLSSLLSLRLFVTVAASYELRKRFPLALQPQPLIATVILGGCRSKQLVKAIKDVYGPHSEVHKKVRAVLKLLFLSCRVFRFKCAWSAKQCTSAETRSV